MEISAIIESLSCKELSKSLPESLVEQIKKDVNNNTTFVIEATAFDILNEADSATNGRFGDVMIGWFKTFISFCANAIDAGLEFLKNVFTRYSSFARKNADKIKQGWDKVKDMKIKFSPYEYINGHVGCDEYVDDIIKHYTGFSVLNGNLDDDITEEIGSIVDLKKRVMNSMIKSYLTMDGVEYKTKNFIECTVGETKLTPEYLISYNSEQLNENIKSFKKLIAQSRKYNESQVKRSMVRDFKHAQTTFSIVKMGYSIMADISNNGIYIIRTLINEFHRVAKAAVNAAS